MEVPLAEDTAAAVLETPPVEEVAPPSETPEIVASESVEETTDEAPETVESLTREEHERLLEEAREAVRTEQRQQAEEAQAQYAQSQYAAQINANRQFLAQTGEAQMRRTFDWMKGQIEEGKEIRWTPQVFQSIAGQLSDASWNMQWELSEKAFEKKFGSRPTDPALERKLRTAIAQGNGDAALDARYEVLYNLALDQARGEVEREQAEKNKTDELKRASEARQGRNRPTPPKGEGAAVRNPSDIIADPTSSLAEKRRAYRDAHGIDPPF